MSSPDQVYEKAKLAVNVPLSAQARLLAIVETLAGHEISGLSLKEVVQSLALPIAQSTVWRDLETLKESGWAQQTADGRWTLSSRPYQLLHHFYDGLKTVRERIAEVSTNYTRIPT